MVVPERPARPGPQLCGQTASVQSVARRRCRPSVRKPELWGQILTEERALFHPPGSLAWTRRGLQTRTVLPGVGSFYLHMESGPGPVKGDFRVRLCFPDSTARKNVFTGRTNIGLSTFYFATQVSLNPPPRFYTQDLFIFFKERTFNTRRLVILF